MMVRKHKRYAMNREYVRNLTITGMFLAIGLVLPFLTGQLQSMGNALLPMHLPVFLCALICGWKYAVPMAFVLPPLRSLLFTMPPLYPTAVSMAFELAVYALVTGLVYALLRKKNVLSVYISVIAGMLAGRAVWGCVQALLLEISGKFFGFAAFIAGAFTNAVPGIILQLVLIPAAMVVLDKTGALPFGDGKQTDAD